MSKFTDALTRAKPRLLAMTPLIAAGAVASVAAAPNLSTTGVAIVAALQALSSLASDIVAADVHATLSKRVLSDDVLKNHDLMRAVRDTINVIILNAADEVSDKQEKATLEKMTHADENVWAEAEALLRQPQTIERLAMNDVIEMFSKSAEEFARFKSLDFEAWRDLVVGLAAVNSVAIEGDVFSAEVTLKLSKATIDLAASRLHETFPRVLYEILKQDFAGEGKAYSGLLIKLVGNISASQVRTREAAFEILGVTKQTLEAVERIEGKVDKIHEKLNFIQAPPAAMPARLAINLPPQNRLFTGRQHVLDALKRELEKNHRAALSGMPGVGKTQTAIQYAHEQYLAQAYDYVIYARAASETELLTDFVRAAQSLNLPANDDADINQVASAVKAWLEITDKWLLIFDNADELTIVHSHIPANQKGHIIFTRRPHDAGGVAHAIKIKKMDEEDGALLLLRRIEFVKDDVTLDVIAPDTAEQARAISREIDGLPLSLDIAGAFIKETSTTLDEYLELYRTEGRALRQERDPNASYEHSVATVFALAFRQVATPDSDDEESAVIARAAADVLRLCAFLAPNAIPLELIFSKTSDLGEYLQQALSNRIWWKKSIARTMRYALLDINIQGQTYDMHREAQSVMRDELDDESQQLWAKRALQSLVEAFPDFSDFAQWGECDLVLPHAQICLEQVDKLSIESETVAELKAQTGAHLYNRARYEEAEPLFKQALEFRMKLFGSEHPDVISSINNLATSYYSQHRYEEAEPLFKQALELRMKLFGSEHPDVAIGINNLAALYRAQKRYEEAEPLLKQNLEIRMKLFGSEHPKVAMSMDNLAMLYRAQEHYEEAEPLFKQALKLWKKFHGLEHPDVAISMNNLATLYYLQGRYEEAETLFKQALAMAEKTLGATHPNTDIVREAFKSCQKEKSARKSEQCNIKNDGEEDGY